MVANAWGVDLNAPDLRTALPILVDAILNHVSLDEVIFALPKDAQEALAVLMQHDGRMLWPTFAHQFGELRPMGAGKRERDRPDLKPAWTTEVLWYRALIGIDFMDPQSKGEPQEYVYIPDDLLAVLPRLQASEPPMPGRPATPTECALTQPATSRILDDICTLLAALRLRLPAAEIADLPLETSPTYLRAFLIAAGLLEEDDLPNPEKTRAFLESPRGAALAQLVRNWVDSTALNELRLLPGLKMEGEWANFPQPARRILLDALSHIPEGQWWNLDSFVEAIHQRQPDFQRPSGDYDSWFIRQESTGSYLHGFVSWNLVEGALVRFLITGIMHPLGLLDLAQTEADAPISAFRWSRPALALMTGKAPDNLPVEDQPIRVSADGRLTLSALTNRAVRYQVARFCLWDESRIVEGRLEYRYRLSPLALDRARAQNLRVSQLLALLKRHTEAPLPPNLVQALERWDREGTQARIERVALLRVTSAEIITALRKGRAARYLGEALNDLTVIVRPGNEEQILIALAEAGYLASAKLEGMPEV